MRGTLDSTGVYVLEQYSTRITATVTLQSTSANRAIELSTNSGDSFFTPVYDQELDDQIVVVIMAPVSAIRITGEEGDVWDLLI